ncbi:hypothetical protein [Rickettsia felis]|uniref:hypothetical protein n=1 Tax=Rickettsia felis TaxID=42862 RepID=UPI0009D651EA|nr:hypothetical protein [Rickettsia felis]
MSFPRKRESRKNSLNIDKINLKKQAFCRFYWIPTFAGMTSIYTQAMPRRNDINVTPHYRIPNDDR